MDVRATLVAGGKAAKLPKPGQRPLHDPAMAAQPRAGVDPFARDPHPDVPPGEGVPTARTIVGLVSVQLGREFAPVGAANGRDGVEQMLKEHAVVAVGAAQADGERGADAVDHKMALSARFAAIRRIRPGFAAPFLAGTLALSRQARLQSIWSASPSRSKNFRWSSAPTPAACNSHSPRQHVISEPRPNSGGR
jgi:hypothetical protein